jgi:hypothetical protein
MAAVLTGIPEWNRVPAKAHKLLQRCLEKDPRRRLRDLGDAWQLLDDVPVPATKSVLPWKLAATFLALICAIALWAPWRSGVQQVERPSPRLDLDLGPDVSLESTTGPAVVLSPDGTRLAFVSQSTDGIPQLFIRRLDQPKADRMLGTEGSYAPFFSPDGQWVGFFARGKLKKTRVDGGKPVILCDASSGRGASWGEDGNIIAALDPQEGLSQVSSGGGNAIPITKLAPGEDSHRWPQVLPGGKAVLFSVSTVAINFDEADIAVLSLKDRQRKTVLAHAGMYPRYLPSGHLVYVTKGTLFAAPFDPNRLEVAGAAARLEEVSTDPSRGYAQVDFSLSGTFAFRSGGTLGLSTLHWLNSEEKTEALGIEAARYTYPRCRPKARGWHLSRLKGRTPIYGYTIGNEALRHG